LPWWQLGTNITSSSGARTLLVSFAALYTWIAGEVFNGRLIIS
jgi:hypothetical protein